MDKIIAILLIIIAFAILLYTFNFSGSENFTQESKNCSVIEQRENSQYYGMNYLLNTDSAIPTRSVEDCLDICVRNKDCKGYSFYIPGQKCFLFTSGGFVDNRPGYISGRKV